jgi:hypothetical protein
MTTEIGNTLTVTSDTIVYAKVATLTLGGGVTLTDNVISWQEATNATDYKIYFDGVEVGRTTETSYDLSTISLSDSVRRTVNVTVKATAGDSEGPASEPISFDYKGGKKNSVMVANSHMNFNADNTKITSSDKNVSWSFFIGKSATFDGTGKYIELDFTMTDYSWANITYHGNGTKIELSKNGDWTNGVKLIADGNNYKLLVAVDVYGAATGEDITKIYWTVRIGKPSATTITEGETLMSDIKLYMYTPEYTLATPKNVTYDEDTHTVTWDSVENAGYYRVSTNGSTWTKITDTSYLINELGTYTFYIKAGAEELAYSAAAEVAVTYTYTLDHSVETLTICDDTADLTQKANIIQSNGTIEEESKNFYGNSTQSLAWSDVKEYENIFFYATLGHSSLTITKDGYIEFFIKDMWHTSDKTERASGVNLVLFKDAKNKVNGFKNNVSAYKTHNNEYRTDAGNGWSYYKLPLTLFGTEGASFDRIRIAANVTFDVSEIMYLDGLRVVTGATAEADDTSDTEENTILSTTATAIQAQDIALTDTKNNELYIESKN